MSNYIIPIALIGIVSVAILGKHSSKSPICALLGFALLLTTFGGIFVCAAHGQDVPAHSTDYLNTVEAAVR